MSEDNYSAAISVISAILMLPIIALIVWWMVVQWNECRGAGLSVLYCIQHVL